MWLKLLTVDLPVLSEGKINICVISQIPPRSLDSVHYSDELIVWWPPAWSEDCRKRSLLIKAGLSAFSEGELILFLFLFFVVVVFFNQELVVTFSRFSICKLISFRTQLKVSPSPWPLQLKITSPSEKLCHSLYPS